MDLLVNDFYTNIRAKVKQVMLRSRNLNSVKRSENAKEYVVNRTSLETLQEQSTA